MRPDRVEEEGLGSAVFQCQTQTWGLRDAPGLEGRVQAGQGAGGSQPPQSPAARDRDMARGDMWGRNPTASSLWCQHNCQTHERVGRWLCTRPSTPAPAATPAQLHTRARPVSVQGLGCWLATVLGQVEASQ